MRGNGLGNPRRWASFPPPLIESKTTMTQSELISRLVAAYRAGTPSVDATAYKDLARSDAYAVEDGVRAALGEMVGMLKTAIHPDGMGVTSPIYGSHVGKPPDFRMSGKAVLGLEVEVGVVLGKDVKSSADIPAAIDHYFTGVEICGTRYIDRSIAGPTGGLADSQSALGYVIGPRRAAGDKIDDLAVEIDFGGRRIYAAPAKHGFGGVLASLRAYADNQHHAYPLKAGTIVTTGSMCGLVPATGPGHVVARLGDQTVEFDLV